MWKADGTYIENIKKEKFEILTIGEDKFNWNNLKRDDRFFMNLVATHVGTQPGMLAFFALPPSKVPSGWLYCDGREVEKDKYPRLAELIENVFGMASDGKFKLPDYRGTFLRGHDDRPLNDPKRLDMGRTPVYTDDINNQLQQDQNRSHNHGGTFQFSHSHNHTYSGKLI